MKTDALHAVRLARTDLKLLGRNYVALFNVMVLPLLFGFLYLQMTEDPTFVLSGMPGILLIFTAFLNLVNTFTARREELVLKRLRGGQSSAAAIFGGAGLGALAVFVLQVALLIVLTDRYAGTLPSNPVPMIVGGLLGVAVFALLAAAFSGITPSAEMAQLTPMPVLIVLMFAAPLAWPLEQMPTALEIVARVLPVTPVMELMRAGYYGASLGEMSVYVATLLGWVAVGALLVKLFFRWDPRHN
ncbi:ABC transporter permease [Nonomuraea sp. NPDC050663]|uniref:ABC transporter permease n=1 Tax=Nonomuraea sp. NPDC050663 TaxID=3364370 RepID=UPI0037BB4E44